MVTVVQSSSFVFYKYLKTEKLSLASRLYENWICIQAIVCQLLVINYWRHTENRPSQRDQQAEIYTRSGCMPMLNFPKATA